tara:strand:- start:457 stop:1404 length:948 start_codon:yes stop_codon:yes gene_type:complete
MSDVNLGIVGAGNIAVEHLKVIKDINQLNIKAITSRTIKKAEKLAQEFKIPNVCQNIQDMMKNNLDGVLILVSADQIFEVTKKIINYQIPIFVEKPPGLNLEQAKILAELSDKKNLLNMVGFNRRYYSVFHKGIQIIKDKGKLLGISIEGHERLWKISKTLNDVIRSKWIFANSTHTLDLFSFFSEDDPISDFYLVKDSYKENNGDQIAVIMKYNSGTIGNYSAHWYSPGGWSVKLYGEGVTVIFNPLEKGKYIDSNFNEKEILPDQVDTKYKTGFYIQMESFKNMILSGNLKWPGKNLIQSLETMSVASKIIGK